MDRISWHKTGRSKYFHIVGNPTCMSEHICQTPLFESTLFILSNHLMEKEYIYKKQINIVSMFLWKLILF